MCVSTVAFEALEWQTVIHVVLQFHQLEVIIASNARCNSAEDLTEFDISFLASLERVQVVVVFTGGADEGVVQNAVGSALRDSAHDAEVLDQVGAVRAGVALVGISGDDTILEGRGHLDANCFIDVRDVVLGALVAIEDDGGRGSHLILIVLAVRDILSLSWKGQLVRGRETDVFI